MGEFVCCERCWHQTQAGVVEPKRSGCCLMLRLADFARVCVYAQLIVLPSLGSSASHSDNSWVRNAGVVWDAVHATPEVAQFSRHFASVFVDLFCLAGGRAAL